MHRLQHMMQHLQSRPDSLVEERKGIFATPAATAGAGRYGNGTFTAPLFLA